MPSTGAPALNAALLLAAVFGGQAPAAALPPPQPATIQEAVQYDLRSKLAGRAYRIYVLPPLGPPPPAGWPVIYLMDGDQAFPTARFQMPNNNSTGHGGALLVGIGYAGATRRDVTGLRVRDFTPSAPDDQTRAVGGFAAGEGEFGGAEVMRRFIEEELQPALAGAYAIDPKNRTLVGYSLGGLFALHVLFTHPGEFNTVVAGSPSIWWNDREVLKGEAAFAKAVTSGQAAPRVMITSASLEETPQGLGVPDLPPVRKMVAQAAMIGNAKALADRLKALKGGPGYAVRYVLFEGEGHNSGTAAAVGRAVHFALEK